MSGQDRPVPGWLLAAAGLGAGVALGVLAWGEGRVPALAVALPLLIVFSRSRLQAFCVGFGYAAALLRYTASFIASWFDNNLLVGAAAVLAYALITGAVWSAGWRASPRVLRRAAAISVAWILALVASIGAPGHPLIAAGYLVPGSGWLGIAAAFLLPSLVLWATQLPVFASATFRRAGAGAALIGLAAAGFVLNQPAPAVMARAVRAEQTRWGGLRGEDQALVRMQRMGAVQLEEGVLSVVWPESIIGRYEPAMYQVLDVEVLNASRRAGRTQIIGMDIPMPGNRMLNAAVAFYPDGRTATAVARQPAPLSLWKPWRSRDTFVADWTAHNTLNLGQGDRAAVIFCYEEYMPVLYLLNEALDAPSVYLAMTNTWAAQSPAAASIQTWHSLGMARLFGRPYLKAENRPGA